MVRCYGSRAHVLGVFSNTNNILPPPPHFPVNPRRPTVDRPTMERPSPRRNVWAGVVTTPHVPYSCYLWHFTIPLQGCYVCRRRQMHACIRMFSANAYTLVVLYCCTSIHMRDMYIYTYIYICTRVCTFAQCTFIHISTICTCPGLGPLPPAPFHLGP